MPYTRREVRFLESSGSPLTAAQKDKMNSELHQNPALGHAKKGSKEMEKGNKMSDMRIAIMRGGDGKVTGHIVHHEYMPKSTKSGAFMERPEAEAHPFGPKGEKVGHGMGMIEHLKKHLGIGAAASPKTEEGEMEPAAHEPPAEEEESEEGE